MADDTVWREELLAAQMRLELGEISERQFAKIERELLARIREIRERQQGRAEPPGTFRVTGVEASVVGDDAFDEGRDRDVLPPVRRPAARRRAPAYEFIGGKGGVGKTTTAAALALAAAGARHRTLVVSTDPAHSLGDALGQRVGAGVTRVPASGAPLDALELDADRALARWLRARRGSLRLIAERGTYLDDADVDRFLGLSFPGVDELGGLLELTRVAAAGRYDTVVVDTAPTGHTLRLLAVPDTLAEDRGRARGDAGEAPLPAHAALGPRPERRGGPPRGRDRRRGRPAGQSPPRSRPLPVPVDRPARDAGRRGGAGRRPRAGAGAASRSTRSS